MWPNNLQTPHPAPKTAKACRSANESAGSITHGDEKWEYQQRILHDRYQAQYKQARKRGSEEEEGIDHRPLGGCGRSAEAEADDQLGPVATYAGPSGS